MPIDRFRVCAAALALSLALLASRSSFAQPSEAEAAPAVAADRRLSESDRKALEAMQGIWTPVAVDGDENDTDFLTLTIEGDRIAWPPNPGDPILIDTTRTPPRVDFVSGKPGQLGYLANIFKIENGELTLCRLPATRVPKDTSRVQGPGPKRFHPSEGQVVRFRRVEPLPKPTAIIGFSLADAAHASVAFDDEDRAAIAIGPAVLIWDLKANRIVDRWTDPEGRPPASVVFMPDGERLAISYQHGKSATEVWNLPAKIREARLLGNGAMVSPDGKSLLTWSGNGTLRIFDLPSLELRSESDTPGNPPVAGAFHPHGSAFAVAPGGGDVSTFDPVGELAPKETAQSELGRGARMIDLAYHPDGDRLVTLEHDGKRRRRFAVRDAKTLELIKEYEHRGLPHCVDFAPDGKSLYVGSSYGVVDQVDAETGLLLRSYRPMVPETVGRGPVSTVRVSSDGAYLVATSENVCFLWDLREAEAGRPETVRWPQRSPDEIAKEVERTKRFYALPFSETFIDMVLDVEAGTSDISVLERPANVLDAGGRPALSWRTRLLGPAGKKFVEAAMRSDESWDSEWNRRAIPLGADVFGWSGVEKGKTTWQLATGPTTAYDGSGNEVEVESPDCKIFLVETAADRAVVWSEPRDYAFDPQNPRAGLPKDGFHYVDWEGFGGYLRGDVPDDLLRRMFSAKGTIAPDDLLPYTDTYLQRLYR